MASAPPTAAGSLQSEFWYYQDNAGEQQGPMTTAQMRGWFDAGYLPESTRVAASYYGEVPEEMWPISELWSQPSAHAFGGGRPSAAVAAAPSGGGRGEGAEGRGGGRAGGRSGGGAERQAANVGPSPRPGAKQEGASRQKPYDKPEKGGDSGKGGRGKGMDGKGKGKGKGKGDGGGKGEKGGGRGPPPHLLKYEAAKAARLGLVGGDQASGGCMGVQREWKPPK
ncbi:hypothetical protein AB1Y20_023337 [Prymnesium parvum]|uniref:GYF domain-containing protein n=1 Tax=Prymnesium parvum TaxID=97485 RepID=A0AB34JGC3_PRYPA